MRRGRLTLVLLAIAALAACLPPPPPPVFGVNVKLTPVPGADFGAITMAVRPGDPALYVGTQDGQVYRVDGGTRTTALDLSTAVLNSGERGLLGMTFSADGSKLYVHFSQEPDGATAVEELAFSGGVADPLSRRRLLTEPQPQDNHNGGSLLLGPDGTTLFLALGDGGGGNDGAPDYAGNNHDPGGNAQSLDNNLLGKIIRIDPTDGPSPLPYEIPPDNPFVGAGDPGRDEVWSYGLRNPFRMSFDRSTGDLWVGDVGQSSREEVDWVPAADPAHPRGRGTNFGWNRREGDQPGPDASPPNGAVTEPVLSIDRSQGDASIISGYVYRGSTIPELNGVYLYSDFFHTSIRGIRIDSSGVVTASRDFQTGVSGTASFGEDADGELYVLSLFSGVYRIERA